VVEGKEITNLGGQLRPTFGAHFCDQANLPGCYLWTTWDESGLFVIAGDLSDWVRRDLQGLVDQLVNDYLAVNP